MEIGFCRIQTQTTDLAPGIMADCGKVGIPCQRWNRATRGKIPIWHNALRRQMRWGLQRRRSTARDWKRRLCCQRQTQCKLGRNQLWTLLLLGGLAGHMPAIERTFGPWAAGYGKKMGKRDFLGWLLGIHPTTLFLRYNSPRTATPAYIHRLSKQID